MFMGDSTTETRTATADHRCTSLVLLESFPVRTPESVQSDVHRVARLKYRGFNRRTLER